MARGARFSYISAFCPGGRWTRRELLLDTRPRVTGVFACLHVGGLRNLIPVFGLETVLAKHGRSAVLAPVTYADGDEICNGMQQIRLARGQATCGGHGISDICADCDGI